MMMTLPVLARSVAEWVAGLSHEHQIEFLSTLLREVGPLVTKIEEQRKCDTSS
jgi:hypothetical protein